LIEARRVELATGVLSVEVRETVFTLDELCAFAARNNRKRGFLFVSKVLGKHWPATPLQMRRMHEYLASRLDVGGSVLFIAMAETATGLGQGIFEAYLNRRCANDALFLHTTRYRVPGREFVGFEETHCHAPQHNLYLPADRVHRHLFRNAQELVLVDDEISTGSTFCNLVEAYRRYNPGLKRVHFVAITDFSGADGAVCFSARLAVPVTCVAALSGAFAFAPGSVEPCETAPSAVGNQRCAPGFVAEGLGRFGVDGPTRRGFRGYTWLCRRTCQRRAGAGAGYGRIHAYRFSHWPGTGSARLRDPGASHHALPPPGGRGR